LMINFIELKRTHNRDNFDCETEELNYFNNWIFGNFSVKI